MTKYFVFLMALASLSYAGMARAEDPDIYEPIPPRDSAFVRFVNVDPTIGTNNDSPHIDGKKYGAVSYGEITPYYVLPQGMPAVHFGEADSTPTLEAGKFYTMVLRGNRIVTLNDVLASTNPNKAQIIFYNLSANSPVTLRATTGMTTITPEPVATDKSYARALNAVRLESGIYSGDSLLATVEPLTLERNRVYAIIVISDADAQPKVITAISRTDSKKYR